MLSVLMFCPQYLPAIGGTERQAAKISEALAEAGCKVRVLTPKLFEESPDHETSSGFEVVRFPFTDLSKSFSFRGIGLLNVLNMRRIVLKAMRQYSSQFDVVHAHNAGLLSAFACDAAERLGKPFLCKVSTSRPTELELLDQKPVYGKPLARRLSSGTGLWLGVSSDILRELESLGIPEENLAKLPNGVPLPSVADRKPPVRKFCYIGRLATTANRDTGSLIQAFTRLASSHPKCELAIVGGGNLLEDTRQVVSRAMKSDPNIKIHMPGFDDARKWFDWSDAFVLPSRQEGLSNALLEAMAEGLPCIANDIPPNREALDNGRAGLLPPVEDAEALYSCMKQVVEDERLAVRLGKAARKQAEQVYDIKIVASRLAKLYETLIKNERRPSQF